MFSSIFPTRQDPGVPIFCIHSSFHLSGNIRSAETSKLNFPDLNIPIIDTQLVASPQGAVAHLTALWNKKGDPPAEIHPQLIDLSSRRKIYFLFATLDYLPE